MHNLDEPAKVKQRERALEKGKFFMEKIMGSKKFLFGDKPSVADIYAYICFTWSPYVDVDISQNPAAVDFMERMKAIPEIAKAHEEMNAASA